MKFQNLKCTGFKAGIFQIRPTWTVGTNLIIIRKGSKLFPKGGNKTEKLPSSEKVVTSPILVYSHSLY